MKMAVVADDDGLIWYHHMGSSVSKNRASRDHANSSVVIEQASGRVVYQRFWGDVSEW
jgi:hypothetical protein